MMDQQAIGVTVIVMIIKDGKVLLGKRKNSLGAGTWSFPGGHLEFQETFEQCARREVLEETGLEITNLHYLTATNNIFSAENKHYVSLVFTADWLSGQATSMEPDKCEEWLWFTPEEIPQPLFLPVLNCFEQLYRETQDLSRGNNVCI